MIDIIQKFSIFFWILPLYKQYKGSYFYFFLILALTDPIFRISKFLELSYIPIGPVSLFLLSLASFGKRIKLSLPIILFFVLFILVLYFDPNNQLFKVFVCLVSFINFIKRLLLEQFSNSKINLFYIAASFYMLLLLLNLSLVVLNIKSGATYFYFTIIIMYFLALFFTFFNDKDEKIQIKLKKEVLD